MLNNQIQELEQKLIVNGSLEEIKKLELKIGVHLDNQRKSLEVKDKRQKTLFVKHPSLKLVGNIKINNKVNRIEKLEINDRLIDQEDEKNKVLYDFYSKLYQEDLEITQENLKHTTSRPEIQALEEKSFDYEKIFSIIKEMNESSPGSNDITIEFYKKFFPLFGNEFVQILNENHFEFNN